MIAIIGTGSLNSYELLIHSVDATFSHPESFCMTTTAETFVYLAYHKVYL